MIQRKEDLLLSIFLLAFLALILTETKRPVEKANTEAAKNHHVKGDTFWRFRKFHSGKWRRLTCRADLRCGVWNVGWVRYDRGNSFHTSGIGTVARLNKTKHNHLKLWTSLQVYYQILRLIYKADFALSYAFLL